jgi:hypothetical protein
MNGSRQLLVAVRRLLVVAAYALWIGGLVFYGSVVIPIGTRIVGSHTTQGFVTQQVTWVVNVLAIPALGVLVWNLAAEWRSAAPVSGGVLLCTWLLMVASQAALFVMHPALSRMLEPQGRTVLDQPRFDPLHELYIKTTAVQHLAAVVHLYFVLLIWGRSRPAGKDAPPPAPGAPRGEPFSV